LKSNNRSAGVRYGAALRGNSINPVGLPIVFSQIFYV
jgi:hypothetical protein